MQENVEVVGARVVSGDGCVLILKDEYDRLRLIEEKMRMKVRQLEALDCDEFGGIGTGADRANRESYVRALRWALGVEMGEV